MLTATYAPYSHYQKKALLKQWKKEIVQSIYEARNLAINGLDRGWKNVSVWLYMDGSTNDWKLRLSYYGYPYDPTDPDFQPSAIPLESVVDLIKHKDLPNNIWIEAMEKDWDPLLPGQKQFLFFFDAISWKGTYYFWNGWWLTQVTEPEIDVNISYKWANTPTLNWEITYYTNTYIADY